MNNVSNVIITVMMIACQMAVCCTLTPFRRSRKKAYWTIGIVSAVECLIYILVAFFINRDAAVRIQTLLIIPTIVIAFVFSKYRDGRFLFSFFFSDFVLGMLNLTIFMVIASTVLQYSMTLNIFIRCANMVICSIGLIKWVAPRVRKMFEAEGIFWWAVGAAAVVSDFFIYFMPIYPTAIDKRPQDFLIMGMINGLLLVVFIVLIIAIYGMQKSQENKNQLLEMEAELRISRLQLQQSERQYEDILIIYDQIRRTKHDLRHHLLVIGGLCQKKDYAKLSQYVESCSRILPSIPTVQYCQIFEINVLVGYYADICKDEHIDFSCSLRFRNIRIYNPVHLCIILGNAIENALEACRLQTPSDSRFITINGNILDKGTIILSIKNSFDGTVRLDGKGNLLSRKPLEGHGIGIQSIRQIAEESKGWCNIAYNNETFEVRVVLHTVEE